MLKKKEEVEIRCEFCGVLITSNNLGWVKHNHDGTKIARCKKCHKILGRREKKFTRKSELYRDIKDVYKE